MVSKIFRWFCHLVKTHLEPIGLLSPFTWVSVILPFFKCILEVVPVLPAFCLDHLNHASPMAVQFDLLSGGTEKTAGSQVGWVGENSCFLIKKPILNKKCGTVQSHGLMLIIMNELLNIDINVGHCRDDGSAYMFFSVNIYAIRLKLSMPFKHIFTAYVSKTLVQ